MFESLPQIFGDGRLCTANLTQSLMGASWRIQGRIGNEETRWIKRSPRKSKSTTIEVTNRWNLWTQVTKMISIVVKKCLKKNYKINLMFNTTTTRKQTSITEPHKNGGIWAPCRKVYGDVCSTNMLQTLNKQNKIKQNILCYIIYIYIYHKYTHSISVYFKYKYIDRENTYIYTYIL